MSDAFRCLAIESATNHGSVALSTGANVLSLHFSDARASSRQVFQLISELLREAELRPDDLDCIAFGCGPGSFTGVRVAASVAQGLAYAQSLPVCRISSLAALAAAAVAPGDAKTVVSCIDARMGEAYLGAYRVADDGVSVLLADQLVKPEEFCLPRLAGQLVTVGHGWEVYPALRLRITDAMEPANTGLWPGACEILKLARSEFASGNTVAAADALPNYVRNRVTN
jgi:tRNA threonylcarbamoyladenosine biosynthesis protein TsaB